MILGIKISINGEFVIIVYSVKVMKLYFFMYFFWKVKYKFLLKDVSKIIKIFNILIVV